MKKKVAISAGTLAILALVTFFAFRSKPRAELAVRDLIDAIFEGDSPTHLAIYSGLEELPKTTSDRIVLDVVRPWFSGCKLQQKSVERRGPSLVSGSVSASCSDGSKVYLALNALDATRGGGVSLIRLLETTWESQYLRVMQRYPASRKEFAPYYQRGIAEDRPKLERIGIRSLVGPNGKPMSLAELEEYYMIFGQNP